MTKKILEPYLILDFTDERGEIGPMVLGDLGADVIRVETPAGSDARRCPPFADTDREDLRSLQFLAFNRNKRSIVLDPTDAEDCVILVRLIERADFIFESGRTLASAYDIDIADAQAINDRIVHVRLTAYGNDGPHADLVSNDLTITSMAGPVSLQGPIKRAPIKLSVPQVWRHAGAEAAGASLVAHRRVQTTGKAQFVDLSAQCAMTWTMLNGMGAKAIQGFEFERTSSLLAQGSGTVELVHPAADGHTVAIPNGAVLQGCTEGMIEDGIVGEEWRSRDWEAYAAEMLDPDLVQRNLMDGTVLCQAFFAKHSKHELFEYGISHGCTLAPVNTLAELLAMPHLGARDYWRKMTLASGDEVDAPGLWAKPSAFELSIERGAPGLDEHGEEIRHELEQARDRAPIDEVSDALPFEGIRVADFSWVGVGPISAKYLADHGATATRVESEGRPDVLRGGMPFKDDESGWNRSQFFGDFNSSKRSLTLNMKTEAGMNLARKLIANSDVLIESFAPGVIGRMGLGYEEIRKLNPALIMISTCLMGQTGPAADLAGFGYHAASIAGFYEVTGWPDLAPSAPWIAYTDTIAPRFITTLLAAALDRRRRTGEGCFIDVAQIETALQFLAPELLDMQVNGFGATRMGNRNRFYAPQGVYQCTGDDQWCAIGIDTDEQWQALCNVIGEPDWAVDSAYASHAERHRHHDAIDEAITRWTRKHAKHEAMAILQSAGIAAGAVQNSGDLMQDPQYKHRQFYRYFDHPEMGHTPYAGHQYRISDYDNGPRGPAPCIGEQSFEVLSEVLGLSDEEIAEAYASGAIS
jgi:crotonobetainyl-CoA:carnitine CoA-transferase CaiB-like acyl-CoA transferase